MHLRLTSPLFRVIFTVNFILLLAGVSAWTQNLPRVTTSLRTKAMAASDSSDDANSKGLFKVLGICGGIGSGKSAACKLLVSELGCIAHIEADLLAHSVYEAGSPAAEAIIKEFDNPELVNADGELNRRVLGSVVFADVNAMQRLERIVWPYVQAKIFEHIARIRSENSNKRSHPVIVLEAAVLLDAGWQSFLDGVWVVHVAHDVALERLQSQRGLSASDTKGWLNAQQSRRGIGNLQQEVDQGVVTAVIDNSQGLEHLRDQLKAALVDPKSWYARS